MSKLGSKASDTFVADLSGGVVPTSQLGAGTPDGTTFLRGDQSWEPAQPQHKGSDITAASTISPSVGNYFVVNGNATIDNITNSAAYIAKLIQLEFTGTPTIKHHSGGTGNIRFADGQDKVVIAGDFVMFISDGTLWKQTTPLASGGASFATPTIALGSSAAAGAAATVIRSDSTIAAFDVTNPTASAPGDSAAVGTAAFAARRDHKHAREAFATPSIALSDTAAAGAASTIIRSDATIVAFNDSADPNDSRPGDAANTGNDAYAARRDHVHSREDFAFFDDFTAGPSSFPFPGASGMWTGGSSGGGSALSPVAGETNAVGVWLFESGTGAGVSHMTISPTDGTTFNLNLVPGLIIGFRVRVHSTDFTRGHLMVGFSNMDLSTSAVNDGTESCNFGMWAGGTSGYPLNADAEKDTLYFRARHSGNDSIHKFGTASTTNTYVNIRLHVSAEQEVKCYIDGSLETTLSGSAVPPSTQALALRIRMETRGSSDPGSSQKSYIDRVFIDARNISRNSGAF